MNYFTIILILQSRNSSPERISLCLGTTALHLWSTHVHVSLNIRECLSLKRVLRKEQQLFSKRKVAKLFGNGGSQLFNKLNIFGIFLILLSPNASEND